MKVTGETITDEQIRELRVDERIVQALYVEAIWGVELKSAARALCADAWNALMRASGML